SKAMDDYLVLPPMALQAGKAYAVSMDAWSNSASYTERLEVVYGTAATADALTNVLIQPTDLTGLKDDPNHLEAFLSIPADGIYYLALHGVSDADKFYLYVDNLSIGAPTSGDAPGVCTNIVVTPDANGDLKANVAFKAPAINIAGTALSAITKIEVSRGGSVVKTFENPSVGAALSFDDVVPQAGNTTYSFVATNNDGTGMAVSSEPVFVGFNVPAAPETVTLVETSTPGEVTVSWSAVTTDVAGKTYPAGTEITYAVCEYTTYGWSPIYNDLTGTSHTFQAVEAGQQDFAQYAVFAFYEGNNGSGTVSDMVPVGTPYDGLEESFADGQIHYIWGTGFSYAEASWSIYDDSKFTDLASADGDNGYAVMNGQYLNACSSLFSGKISLVGSTNPGVSFSTFNIAGDDINEINVYVKEASATEWTLVENVVINSLGENQGWLTAVVSLAQYADKVIQVRFEGLIKKYQNVMLDQIKVGSMVPNDLVAKSISAPATVAAGSDYTVDVEVRNNGTAEATAFTVELYADQQLAETKSVEGLASGASTTVSFDATMGAVAETPTVYYAVVVYAADENTANNTTDQIEVAPKHSTLPKVEDLAGAQVAEGIKLTWSEPNLDGAPETVTEGFEDYEGGSADLDGWTFVDVDGAAVGGFQNMDVPGIEVGTSTASFFVFDSAWGNQTFAAHSGEKYLAALFRYDDGQTDDWMISPELTGAAQTVSFYARSYSAQYPEKIVVYAGTSTEPATLKQSEALLTVASVPGEWTLYEVQVPAGATHFAINSCASGSFMLMVDDVTYERASQTASLSIVGYDVYRDGLKLNAEPTGETEYLDTTASDGAHTYVVVTVYNKGISAPSNSVEVTYSGLENITAGISIKAVDGNIIVAGAEGQPIAVSAVNGATVYAGTAAATTTVPVSTGVYLVKVGSTVAKIIVR
ncbi:MAG: choice-of-anchor J domain-containing protein, partial [Roseburia sp.]|nr:choice-of-anchor J domain-containing protein [Roseburia sp.]